MTMAPDRHALDLTAAEAFAGVRPGRVIETDGDRALVEVEGLRAWAEPAMPIAYTPTAGDELLVAGGPEGVWIIGVVRGKGRVALRGLGDVRVESLGGSVTVGAADAVELQAARVSIFADALTTVARTARESLETLVQVVTGRRVIRAGSDYRVVEGLSFQKTERMHCVSRQETRIDGSTVHLG